MASATETTADSSDTLDTGESEVAHIIRSNGDTNAAALVTTARINGTPLEALCGETFMPTKNPLVLPICALCKEIYDLYRIANEHLHESPQSA